MKLKALAQICKQEAYLGLCDGGDQQWVKTRNAFYPLGNLPKLDLDNLATILDLTAKEYSKIRVEHIELPEEFDFSDIAVGEKQANMEITSINFGFGDGELTPVKTTSRLEFFKASYMKPLSDRKPLEIHERSTITGDVYFAVKLGLLVSAVILPEDITSGEISHLEYLAKESRATRNFKKKQRKEMEGQLALVK